MATKKANDIEEKTVKVKAKVNLKYDSDVLKAGKEFLIRQSDVKSMEPYIDVIDMPKDTATDTNAGQQQAPQNIQSPAK